MLLRHFLRIFKDGSYCVPHDGVPPISAFVVIVAHAAPAKAIGVGSNTSIVGVISSLALFGCGAHRSAGERIAADLALQQALQQVTGATRLLTHPALVLAQLFLRGLEYRSFNESW